MENLDRYLTPYTKINTNRYYTEIGKLNSVKLLEENLKYCDRQRFLGTHKKHESERRKMTN